MALGQVATNTVTLFYFQASEIPASEVGNAISEHFGGVVVCEVGLAEKLVSGRIVTDKLPEAVSALCFLLGARYRTEGGMYLICSQSGGGARRITSFPSYGLKSGEASTAFGQGGAVIGDRIVITADEATKAEVGNVLKDLGMRRSLVLEVVALDCNTNVVDRVNTWLDSVRVALGVYTSNWLLPGAGTAVAAGQAAIADVRRRQGLVYDVDLRSVLQLLDLGGYARVESRQQLQVMSGSSSQFEAGTVVQDVTYTAAVGVPGTVGQPQQLVSNIERRVVGLNMRLQAAAFEGGRWFLDYELEDSSFGSGGVERRNRVTGQRLVDEAGGWFLIASLTRKADSEFSQGLPLVSGVKFLRRATTKKLRVKEDRQLMVMARPILMR